MTEDTGSTGWARADDDAEPSAPLPFRPEPSLEDYQPLGRWALPARAWLAAVTLIYVVALVFDVWDRSLRVSIGTDDPATAGELQASDDRLVAVGLAVLVGTTIAAAFFMAWLKRAYSNLRALGVRNLRFRPGWAIGSWFIPIVNLFLPKQIVNDVWRGSDPELEDSESWHDKPVPALFALWWLLWVVGSLLSSASGLSAEGPGDYELSSTIAIAADALLILAGVLAVVVVDRTTARQVAAVARAGGGEHSGSHVRPWLRSWPAVASAAVLFAAAAAAAVLVIAAQPSDESTLRAAVDDPSAGAAPSAPASFSHSDDFSDPSSGWIVQEDEHVAYTYADGGYEVRALQAEETWFSILLLGVTMDHMVVEADATLRAPASADESVGVGCFATERAGYLANVWPDGYYAIVLDPVDVEEFTFLEEGTSDAIGGAGSVNRIGIECERGPPAVVTLTVNGTTLAEARTEDIGPLDAVALHVSSGPDPAIGRFDNVAIRAGG